MATSFLACSNNNGNNGNGNGSGGADMALGSGGNGGDDMAMSSGGGDGGFMTPDLAGIPMADHDPKQHAPEPTMGSTYSTNSTFTAPVIYPAVWTGTVQSNGKDTATAVHDFVNDMIQSDYWLNGTKEYGVGKGTVAAVIPLGAPPSTIDDSALSTMVKNNLGKPGWPKSGDKNAIVLFVSDVTTTVTNQSASSCKDFGGYHSNTSPLFGGGTAYAVANYCYKPMSTTPDFDELTIAISHEIAETATDYTLRVNRVSDGSGTPFLGGGEDGDMCLDLDSTQKWASGTYQVSRLFSNAVAMANNADPCLPNDQGPFFGASFDSGDAQNPGELKVMLSGGAGQGTFKITPFEYDPSVGPIAFYIVGSVLPAGVTFDPDIAVRTDPNTGMTTGHVMYANAGSTVNVTVKFDSSYQPSPLQQTVQLLIVARNVDKSRYNLWWADINAQ